LGASREAALSSRVDSRSRIARRSFRRRPGTIPGGLFAICLCKRWRLALLRSRLGRHLASCRHLCRSHPAR
jgi:hypothetical protein